MTYSYFEPASNLNKRLDGKRMLIGLGAQKAGTTWLSDYLARHPDVFMSPIKELHYFDLKYVPGIRPIQESHFITRMRHMASQVNTMDAVRDNSHAYKQLKNYIERFEMQSVDDYLNFFRKRMQGEQVCCEISPGYALLEPQHYAEIYAMHDDVRMFFIMRDPIERFWSNLRFYEGLLSDFDARRDFDKALEDPMIFGRTDYDRTIKAVLSVVSTDHFLPLFYENLFEAKTIRHFTDFAGIRGLMPDFSKHVLKSRDIPITNDMKKNAFTRFAPVYDAVLDRFEGHIPDAWKASMREHGGRKV